MSQNFLLENNEKIIMNLLKNFMSAHNIFYIFLGYENDMSLKKFIIYLLQYFQCLNETTHPLDAYWIQPYNS